MKTEFQKMSEVKELLDRFMITPRELSSSPQYEKDMIIDKGFLELEHDSFCLLVDLMYSAKKIKHERVKKNVLCVETGEIKTQAGWQAHFNNNPFLYKKLKNGVTECTFKNLTFRKLGDWQ